MDKNDLRSLLVIGLDVVSLASSASRAGYRVYVADYFGDQDLDRVCHESRSIVRQKAGETCGRLSKDFSLSALLRLARELLESSEIDAALLSSGIDDSQDVLRPLNDLVPILGNSPEVVERIRNKTEFFRELGNLGIPHPETAVAEDIEDAKKKAIDMGFPVVVKPSRGFGGAGVRKADNSRELKQAFREAALLDSEVLIQEYLIGIPASASIISSKKGAVALTLNEQLLGVHELGQKEPFGYCGNIVPLSATKLAKDTCRNIVEKVSLHFGLIGSNGIDFVISKEDMPFVIEVNPRFQGTLECVERVLGMNIVEAHVEACIQGKLPTIMREKPVFCVRMILYAPERSIVPDLNHFEEVRDIPLPGGIIEKGEPVCSIVAHGTSRDSSLSKAKVKVDTIRKSLQPHE